MVGLLLAVPLFFACTPPSKREVEWTVANRTADTLRVTVRYPLDSVRVPSSLVDSTRQYLAKDSTIEYWLRPLDHLAYHDGQWYEVRCTFFLINSYHDYSADGVRHYARIDREVGALTYAVPPHSMQQLFESGGMPSDALSLPESQRMTGLRLQQHTNTRVVLPGRPIDEVFRQVRTGQEYDNESVYRVELAVGSGLTINE